MMQVLYSAAGITLTPLVQRWLHRRAGRGKEDAARMGERFGYASQPRPQGRLIWLHAASVGETQSVLTLVRALLAQYADIHVLITTGTVTSAALVAQQSWSRVVHQYVPVDTLPAVRRFLTHWRPDMVLWVESEFWPQLLWQTRARGIPLLLINARISVQSARGWQRWPRVIKGLLDGFATIYAGSAEDAKRLAALGAKDVLDVGNLKYDAALLPIDNTLLGELAQSCANRRIWVAASTHANEEQMIAEVQQKLAVEFPDLLCILIPRHAVRGNAIAEDLRGRGHRVAQRSQWDRITPAVGIYLADTMGELGSFYRLADIVFLGGSLVAIGGHNPLEPARLSSALVTGPHTHNFTTIMQHLVAHDALRVAADKDVLAVVIAELLRDDAQRLGMAERALQAVEQARGASEHILRRVAELLPEKPHENA